MHGFTDEYSPKSEPRCGMSAVTHLFCFVSGLTSVFVYLLAQSGGAIVGADFSPALDDLSFCFVAYEAARQ